MEGDSNISNSIQNYMTSLRQISLNPEPITFKASKQLFTHLELLEPEVNEHQKLYEAVLNLQESTPIEFLYFGGYDDNFRFDGQAVLKLTSYNSCYKGACKVMGYS